MTTEPVKISPYTIGTGVPALDVFCTPLKLKDSCGSSSELNFCGSGKGNNISVTPVNNKPAPIPNAAFAAKLAVAKLAPKPLPKTRDLVIKPPAPKERAIKAPPSNIYPIFPPCPLITGIK